MLPRIDLSLTARWLLAGWLASVVLFRGAPTVDIDLARLFWSPETGWFDRPLWQSLRDLVWNAEIAVFAVAVIACGIGVAKRRAVLGMGASVWGYIAGLFLIGPVLLVNGWLKNYSGRARPANITEFGGDRTFSPAGDFVAQCAKNCSFVSGETSSAVALGVAFWIASAVWRLESWQRLYLRVAGVLIPVFIIVQRVTSGRHFLSDAVFATLLVLTLAWGLLALASRARS